MSSKQEEVKSNQVNYDDEIARYIAYSKELGTINPDKIYKHARLTRTRAREISNIIKQGG